MAAWFDPGQLKKKMTNLLPIGGGHLKVLTALLEAGDPRATIQPLEAEDWLCPFTGRRVELPGWDGSAQTLLQHPAVQEHLKGLKGERGVSAEAMPMPVLAPFFIKLRLELWPNYHVSNTEGKWVCPHCLCTTEALIKNWDESEVQFDWFLPEALKHLAGCEAFRNDPLNSATDVEVRGQFGEGEVRKDLLKRVQQEPIFRVTDDSGAWIDPFSERPVEHLNLKRAPWNAELQNAIVDYLLSDACPGAKTRWRTPKTLNEMQRIAGQITARRQALFETSRIKAAAEVQLAALRHQLQQASAAADQHQELKMDLAAARKVQLKMLPDKPPDLPGYDIAVYYDACSEVGGDMYSFIEADGGRWGFLIGDVSGHGAQAALIMSMTMQSFSLRGKRSKASTTNVMKAVNDDLDGAIPHGKFASAFYIVLDPATGMLSCARAGHNPALLYQPSKGSIAQLTGGGVALGMVKSEKFAKRMEHYEALLERGGVLVLYTDGIVEAHNSAGDEFGEEALQGLILNAVSSTSQQLVDYVIKRVKAFMGERPVEDDFTLVVIKRNK